MRRTFLTAILLVMLFALLSLPSSAPSRILSESKLSASTNTAAGPGYYLAGSGGATYAFGAPSYGSTYTYGLTGLGGAHPLNAPIVGMAAVPNGGGYWLVAADGGVFDFGDANFYGSLGAQKISAPIVAVSVAGQSGPTISTAALPGAIVGQPYTNSIDVTGGDGSVTVTATGLPPGLTLAPNGTLKGIPQSAGLAPITVTATDAHGDTTTESIELSVTNPLQGQSVSATPQASSNWAGYYVEPGSFNAITGTFTVPTLSANQPAYCDSGQATPGCSLSEWVGIDGATNSSLIQAGVELTPQGNGSTYQIFPWWEILPNVQTNVNTLSVNSGNQITVNIFKTTKANNWEIQIINDSTGASFNTKQPYSGPGTSAEWITEAPSTTSNTILEVPTLSSPVTFTSLGIGTNASVSEEVQTYLCQVLPVQPGTLTDDSFQVTQLSGSAQSGPCSNGAFLNSTAILHE
ncbi:G1 family glutamic endopeptidase [Ferrimicrobium sp.]|uniref:G1 family glutamic endopeptidase n=1 Tax=Ferrimicrobium sp. TaxID=2926050 RepID=UPI0026356F9D|nr:G1 family glutamic endopeptidase [Ferrimicrobium sp.]